MKRRRAVEDWKVRNRDYYLEQKRALAARPEYLAKRRYMYRLKRIAFLLENDLPRRGRPPRSRDQEINPLLRKYIRDEFEETSEGSD